MKSFFVIISQAIFIFMLACEPTVDQNIKNEYPESLIITAENATDLKRNDEAIILDVESLKIKNSDFNPNAYVIFCKGTELASQANDLNRDGEPDQIAVITDFKSGETKKLEVRYATSGTKLREYPKRTQAELSVKVGGKFVNRKYEGGAFQNVQFLRVPPEHTDHSFYIRYEGPGWESDKVGYRFYLDWRNASDIYGKKTSAMALQNVGQDGFDSYHEMSDWGMDILKVGESLGIGSIGIWHDNKANRVSQTDSVTCEIVLNGSVESLIQTKYFGWKVGDSIYNLTSDLSILAGSRLTKHDLQIEPDPENLCSGIVKLPEAEIIKSSDERANWSYLATYGKQSLVPDFLGMAILFNKKDLLQMTEDEFSHVIILKPASGRLTYYFLGAWEQEPYGIKSKEVFIDYLNKTVQKLDHPISVNY